MRVLKRLLLGGAVSAAMAAAVLAPAPAAAWEGHHGWGWHGGWHHGWGWRGGLYVGGPAVVVGGPGYYAPGYRWIPGHYTPWGAWIPAHWGY